MEGGRVSNVCVYPLGGREGGREGREVRKYSLDHILGIQPAPFVCVKATRTLTRKSST